jgi:hypothetical protein
MSEPSIAVLVQDVAERELERRGFRPAPGEAVCCSLQTMLRKYAIGTSAGRAEGAVALRIQLVARNAIVLQADVGGRSEQPIDHAVGAQAMVALEAAVTDAIARLAAAPAFAEAWAGGLDRAKVSRAARAG